MREKTKEKQSLDRFISKLFLFFRALQVKLPGRMIGSIYFLIRRIR